MKPYHLCQMAAFEGLTLKLGAEHPVTKSVSVGHESLVQAIEKRRNFSVDMVI